MTPIDHHVTPELSQLLLLLDNDHFAHTTISERPHNESLPTLSSPLRIKLSDTMKYTLAPFVQARPWLRNALMPIANWYANAAGYRQYGLRYGTPCSLFSLVSSIYEAMPPFICRGKARDKSIGPIRG